MLRSGHGLRPLPGAHAAALDDPRLHGQGGRAGRRRAREGPPLPGRHRPSPGRDGLAGHPVPRGRGWRRARHAGVRDRDRGDRPRLGLAGPDRRRPHEPGLRAAPPRRHPRAEGAVPRADGERPGDRRLRADRAGRGIRRRRHADDRRAGAGRRRRGVGPRTAASASSRTPARPGRTSSPPGPARPTRATPRSPPSSSPPTRPGSASAGSRRSWGCTRRRPAS